MTRKICAWIILFLLVVVPFLNWRLGAVLWMCACLTYICQELFNKRRYLEEDENHDGDV